MWHLIGADRPRKQPRRPRRVTYADGVVEIGADRPRRLTSFGRRVIVWGIVVVAFLALACLILVPWPTFGVFGALWHA